MRNTKSPNRRKPIAAARSLSKIQLSGAIDLIAFTAVVAAIELLHRGGIAVSSPIWAVFLAPVLTAAAAYRLRETRRIGYGQVEWIVGAYVGVLALVPQQSFDSRAVFAFLAAVYVMVRGLDNIATGLKAQHPGAARRWMAFWHY